MGWYICPWLLIPQWAYREPSDSNIAWYNASQWWLLLVPLPLTFTSSWASFAIESGFHVQQEMVALGAENANNHVRVIATKPYHEAGIRVFAIGN